MALSRDNATAKMIASIQKMLNQLDDQPHQRPKSSRNGKSEPRRFLLLKISLKESSPPIWRRFVAPSDMPLDVFHECLQIIMGWENSHLYEFLVGDRRNGQRYVGNPMGDMDDFFGGMDDYGDLNASDYDLSFLKRKGMKFTYVYDFGDSWTHEIVVEDANYDYSGDPPVVVLKGKMNCPPEDCGGLYGYYDILELLKNPKKDKDGILEWLGEYDPDAFDMDEINTELTRRVVGPKPKTKKAVKKTVKKAVKKVAKKSTKKKSP